MRGEEAREGAAKRNEKRERKKRQGKGKEKKKGKEEKKEKRIIRYPVRPGLFPSFSHVPLPFFSPLPAISTGSFSSLPCPFSLVIHPLSESGSLSLSLSLSPCRIDHADEPRWLLPEAEELQKSERPIGFKKEPPAPPREEVERDRARGGSGRSAGEFIFSETARRARSR